jgi:hypothetical protein
VFVLLACLIGAVVALAEEDVTKLSGDPVKVGLMTPAAKAELYECVGKAIQTAGDENDRLPIFGVYIGPKGRAVSLAVLQSSGLERLDKLVLHCLFLANFTPTAPGKPQRGWFFTTPLKGKRPATNGDRELALLNMQAVGYGWSV